MANSTALLIKIRRKRISENITLLVLFSMLAIAVSMVLLFSKITKRFI